MTTDALPPSTGSKWFWLVVALFAAASLALKLPVMLRQHAAQDEDFFAVPGWTILRGEGPRIPYLPSRDPASLFYRADEGLFALPPLQFYWEAVVYVALGPSTGSARVASGLAGVVAVLLLAGIGRRLGLPDREVLLGTGLYAFSRCVYFPWLMARPDALCGMLGFAAVLAMLTGPSLSRRSAIVSGACVGFGGLAHPFALVFGLQCLVGTWLRSERPSRAKNSLLFVAMAAAPMLLWLPAILDRPDLFRHQFLGNVVNQAGPGLPARIVWPVPSLRVQSEIFLEHVGPWQAALMVAGLCICGSGARRSRSDRVLFTLALTAIALHVVMVGTHATKGYWCYTGGLMWLCTGRAAGRLATAFSAASVRPAAQTFGFTAIALVAAALLIPGCGIRTLLAHVRNWNDPNYDASRFTRQLLETIPPESVAAVDPSYVFEYSLSGRRTLLALEYTPFFRVSPHSVDYLVAGEYALRDGVPQQLQVRLIQSLGDPNDPFACSAEIFVPTGAASPIESGSSGDQAPTQGPP